MYISGKENIKTYLVFIKDFLSFQETYTKR